jgi:hypothetical protein
MAWYPDQSKFLKPGEVLEFVGFVKTGGYMELPSPGVLAKNIEPCKHYRFTITPVEEAVVEEPSLVSESSGRPAPRPDSVPAG